MKNSKWKTYLFWIALAETVGIISGWISPTGIQVYGDSVIKPSFSPPPILFPIVWTILYALMGISAARIHMTAPNSIRNCGLNLYITQLIVNFFWSPIFFNAQAYGFALIWLLVLWFLVQWMILTFHKLDPIAAYIQIPYLLWLTFAVLLCFAVWNLNK